LIYAGVPAQAVLQLNSMLSKAKN